VVLCVCAREREREREKERERRREREGERWRGSERETREPEEVPPRSGERGFGASGSSITRQHLPHSLS